jgi:hypothetical protein
MAIDLPAKLRLTAAVLGCAGRKDLCARFRAVNPTTHFDLERSHKWMQGRAVPRSPQVYADWARVLGTVRSGDWLAVSTLAAFEDELASLFGTDIATLRSRLAAAQPMAMPDSGAPTDLVGHYACYSLAWSPYNTGKLVRASIAITRGAKGLLADYVEWLLGSRMSFTGELILRTTTVHVLLRGPATVAPMLLSLMLPGVPGSVLCGVLSGANTIGPQPVPSATRMVLVRVPHSVEDSNRFLPYDPESVVTDLAALGFALPDRAAAVALMRTAIAGDAGTEAPMQVQPATQTALAALFDPAWMDQPAA